MASTSDKNADVITSEHAVLIAPVPTASSILAYVEAVATVIGSCHIHSVFEDEEFIKVYLNDKKFVDFLVNTGVSVLGRRVNVEYAVPRADKVTLRKVDPIIPDSILMRFLCFYGTPVSTIIHEKIASNLEYSHIECGVRKIYMNMFNDKKPPSKVSIQYQDNCYRFEMHVEKFDKKVLELDSSNDDVNEEETMDDTQEVESVGSLKPNVEDLVEKGKSFKKPLQRNGTNKVRARRRGRGRPKGLDSSVAYAARKIKSRAAKEWYNVKSKSIKKIGTKIVSGRGGRRGRGGFVRGRGRGAHSRTSVTSAPGLDINLEANGENSSENETEILHHLSPGSSSPEKRNTHNVTQYPLSLEDLKKLMFQTRFHRAPLQVAKEFLAKTNTPEAYNELSNQLTEYHDSVRVQALRIRIRRLVAALRSAMNDPLNA